MIGTNAVPENFIGKILTRAINDTAEQIFEKKKNEMVKELEKRKGEVIAGVTLDIMREVSMSDFQDKLVITIRKPQ